MTKKLKFSIIIAFALMLTLFAGVLAGCGSGNDDNAPQQRTYDRPRYDRNNGSYNRYERNNYNNNNGERPQRSYDSRGYGDRPQRNYGDRPRYDRNGGGYQRNNYNHFRHKEQILRQSANTNTIIPI